MGIIPKKTSKSQLYHNNINSFNLFNLKESTLHKNYL